MPLFRHAWRQACQGGNRGTRGQPKVDSITQQDAAAHSDRLGTGKVEQAVIALGRVWDISFDKPRSALSIISKQINKMLLML